MYAQSLPSPAPAKIEVPISHSLPSLRVQVDVILGLQLLDQLYNSQPVLGQLAAKILLEVPNLVYEVKAVAPQFLDCAPVHKGSERLTEGAARLFDGGGAEEKGQDLKGVQQGHARTRFLSDF